MEPIETHRDIESLQTSEGEAIAKGADTKWRWGARLKQQHDGAECKENFAIT